MEQGVDLHVTEREGKGRKAMKKMILLILWSGWWESVSLAAENVFHILSASYGTLA